jgi:hypothetical protein
LVQLGLLRGDQAQTVEAEKLIRQALDLAHRPRLKPDDPILVNAESSLGKVLVQAGSYDKAIAILVESLNRRALDLDRKVHGNLHPRVAEDLSNIATAKTTTGKYAEAEVLLPPSCGDRGVLVWAGPPRDSSEEKLPRSNGHAIR